MKPLLFKSIAIFTFILFIAGCSTKTKSVPYNDIRNPRFSPDGKQIVFDVANTSYYERVRIYLYSLETKELSTYKAPEGQSFEMASFSDDGKKLVFVTSPIGDRNSSVYEQRNEILLNYQIATMNVDGTDMQALTSDKHLKIFPAFSHKGDKIIYAMAGKIRDKGATPASYYNLWELDIKNRESSLFMGQKFEFYQMGYSTYFNDDESVLMAAYGLMRNLPAGMDIYNFRKKTNGSYAYKIKRGQTEFSMPILMEFSSSTNATMDKDENIYFYGTEQIKEGIKVRMLNAHNQQFTKWGTMWEQLYKHKEVVYNDSLSVSKDGSHIVGMLNFRDSSALGILDTNTGVWSEVFFPKMAKVIRVKQ